MKKVRLYELDRAKGVAIFLVVLGHLVARKPPIDNYWYVLLKTFIYEFHMPFFMFLSGFSFSLSYNKILNYKGYANYVVAKFKRLAPGFLIFGALIIIGKIFLKDYIAIDHIQVDMSQAFYYLLVVPPKSGAGSLWYIYVLLEYYIFVPLLLILVKDKILLLMFISAIFYFLPKVEYFMLDRFIEYLLFFSIGIFIEKNYVMFKSVIYRYGKIFVTIFCASFFLINYFDDSISKLICGILSIPALMFLVKYGFFKNIAVLQVFGVYTYSIYLLNTIMIGLVKGVFLLFFPWGGVAFLLYVPMSLLSGLFVSILVKKYILNKTPYLKAITN